MIHINLLPEEDRRTARTPLKLMVAVTAAVTVNALLLAWYGWLALGVAGDRHEAGHPLDDVVVARAKAGGASRAGYS